MYSLRTLHQASYSLISHTHHMAKGLTHAHTPQRFLASQHKRRPQLGAGPSDQLDQLKSEYFKRNCELNIEEWQNVRQSLTENYKYITGHNVDAVILGMCSTGEQLPMAKSYIKYLQSQEQKPNAATLGRLLRVYNAAYNIRPLSEEEQSEILHICDTVQGNHAVLDASSCENLILGLVATSQHWQRAATFLKMMKVTSSPSVAAYSALATKAFSSEQPELAWRLLEEMLGERKLPKCEVFLAHLKSSVRNVKTFGSQLEQMLLFLQRYDILLTDKVAQQLTDLAQQLPKQLQVTTAHLEQMGQCAACQKHLEHVAISDSQFNELRRSFLDKVLIRKDVFQKSTPEEVVRFTKYVEQTAPYDCVIDGLNVAYSTGTKKPPQQMAQLLATVVRYFKERRKRILVLGRQHMRNWSKPAMHFIEKNASVFLTNNLSQDDPFLLYATLRSGQETDFFSRDLMRSHSFLLGPELKTTFRRWQQEHQYSLVTQTQTGKIIVKEPIRYLLCAHKVDNVWHIPCTEIYTPHPPDRFDVPEKWLCLTIA